MELSDAVRTTGGAALHAGPRLPHPLDDHWQIRITTSAEKAIQAFTRLPSESSVLICAEQANREHVHVVVKLIGRTSDWMRKQIQSIDPSRKGNELYSMTKAHSNSFNYALKEFFEEDTPIVLNTFGDDMIANARIRHEQYIAELGKNEKIKHREKKDADKFITKLIYTLHTKYTQSDTPSGRTFSSLIINDVIEAYRDKDKRLPSKMVMTSIVLTLYSKFGLNHYLHTYYSNDMYSMFNERY